MREQRERGKTKEKREGGKMREKIEERKKEPLDKKSRRINNFSSR